MATDIKMPQLSDTMSSGKILIWKKKEGDAVSRGDILAEVETDKANLEIESFFNGTLLKILTPANSSAKVGEVIAVIGAAGESVSVGSAPAASAPAATPAPKAAAPTPSPSTPAPVIPSAPLSVVTGSDRVKASPLAKRVAEQLHVNLSSVQGSGPNGRIIRRDVEAAAGGSTAPEYQAAPAQQYHAAPAPVAPPISTPAFSTPTEPIQPGAGTYTTLGANHLHHVAGVLVEQLAVKRVDCQLTRNQVCGKRDIRGRCAVVQRYGGVSCLCHLKSSS
jgi:pyruvate dehydrogenase E2 component (dihydrolipoamide acetyltransferase)